MFLSDFRNITQLLNLKPKLMICSPKNIVKKKKIPKIGVGKVTVSL